MCGFCNVWVCVCVGFVMCGFCNMWVWVCEFLGYVMCVCVAFVPCVSFGNVYVCIYCGLYCLYFFVLFRLCIFFLTCFVRAATE
jgi:hypothetical protein